MAYRIAGTYIAGCSCAHLCPCPVDEQPTGPDGTCTGALVFGINDGRLGDTDLSGTAFALYNFFGSNLTAGNWKVGIVIDEKASDEQADAIQRIVGGDEGGPFGDFKGFIGEMLGVERGPVSASDDRASVGGKTDISFEPFKGADGSPTMTKNAMFGFAPEFQIGKASGSSNAFGLSFDARYGEKADFEFSSEEQDVHIRA